MLKRSSFTKVKVFFLMLVYVFNFDLFKFSAAILEKGLLREDEISQDTGGNIRWQNTEYKT